MWIDSDCQMFAQHEESTRQGEHAHPDASRAVAAACVSSCFCLCWHYWEKPVLWNCFSMTTRYLLHWKWERGGLKINDPKMKRSVLLASASHLPTNTCGQIQKMDNVYVSTTPKPIKNQQSCNRTSSTGNRILFLLPGQPWPPKRLNSKVSHRGVWQAPHRSQREEDWTSLLFPAAGRRKMTDSAAWRCSFWTQVAESNSRLQARRLQYFSPYAKWQLRVPTAWTWVPALPPASYYIVCGLLLVRQKQWYLSH